ncbi:prepilin peptidase [Photorhabdus sp. RM71S]|uniref:prepilin peptidase n=1 Tax=Photorhabdus sp. RM71S TaxID=3342824 RepID=UPI0036DDF1E9
MISGFLYVLFGSLPLTFLMKNGGPLLQQGNAFLQSYDHSPYSTQLTYSLMGLVWMLGGIAILLDGQTATLSTAHLLQTFLLMAFSINLIALDAQERYLPLCFTNSFWLAGVLLTQLPGASLSFYAAVITSLVSFIILLLLHRELERRQPDSFGLGDVHLLAGLCAWLPLSWLVWAMTLYVLLTVSLLGRSTSHPLAPWLLPIVLLIHLIHPTLTTKGYLYVE